MFLFPLMSRGGVPDSRQLFQKFGSGQVFLFGLLLLAVDETADKTLELLAQGQLLVRPDDGVHCNGDAHRINERETTREAADRSQSSP